MSLSELLILMVIGLILFGPEDLPDVARAVGKIVYEIKKMVNEATQEFQDVVKTPSNVVNKAFEEAVKPAFDESKPKPNAKQDNIELNEELLTYDEVENSQPEPQTEDQVKDQDPLAELPSDMVSYKIENKGASR